MSYTYHTFKNSLDPRAAEIVDLPDRVEKYYYLSDGIRVAPHLPPSTELHLYEEAGDMLKDFIDNPDRVLYVSQRAREVLQQQGLSEDVIEYLPFVLLDKRGRRVREQYYIANPLVRVPCLDFTRSRYWLDSDDPTDLGGITVLHMLEDRLPADARLFRVAEYTRLVVLRSDLLEALRQAGLTGPHVQPVGMRMT
ncbi:imm11 family protein [Archangium sp.]|uniref:imm11 family protein n=1 Tax=Archangium sp. TaxID=1872627 RepID=UPI002D3EB071|nr:DUF1629 domain-containing protein [Archangium sp.]HYO59978.1 DUF1629 domain-containing protein [Archangium sp.]